jgi:hypothetical protein
MTQALQKAATSGFALSFFRKECIGIVGFVLLGSVIPSIACAVAFTLVRPLSWEDDKSGRTSVDILRRCFLKLLPDQPNGVTGSGRIM